MVKEVEVRGVPRREREEEEVYVVEWEEEVKDLEKEREEGGQYGSRVIKHEDEEDGEV